MKNNNSRTAFFLATIFLLIGSAVNVAAATYTVNQPDDAGDGVCDATCTLRDAVIAANISEPLDDFIEFAPFLTTITLTAEIPVDQSGRLFINGTGANRLTIDGGAGANRIFYTFSSQPFASELVIRDVTLAGGDGGGTFFSGDGGAIYANAPSLRLFRVHLTGNTAATGGGIFFNSSDLLISDSTVSNNTAAVDCGGFNNRGDGLLIINSTISGNTTAGDGGGFCHSGSGSLNFATVSNNTAFRGGGFTKNPTGILHLANSVIAGNRRTGLIGVEIYLSSFGNPGDVTSDGYNLVGNDPGDSFETNIAIAYQPTDILDTPPQIVPLGNYGGTTPTHALQFTSPAKDAADPASGWQFDQRGFDRDLPDIGAVEIQDDSVWYVTQTADANGACDENCSLREAIAAAPAGGTIEFAGTLSGQVISLGGSEILIDKTLTIAGLGADQLTISGDLSHRIFFVSFTGLAIQDVTLANGQAFGSTFEARGGAIRTQQGTLQLERVQVTGNNSSEGGAIYLDGGTGHSIRDSVFYNNGGNAGGGVLYNQGGSLTVTNSTFTGNTLTNFGGVFLLNGNGSTTLRNVTIAGNDAFNGGGISLFGGTLNIGNSIIADNTALGTTTLAKPEILFSGGTVVSAGNNLVGDLPGDAADTGTPITYQPTDILDTPPLLDFLQMNGGTTPTLALLAGSPAVDAGDNSKAINPTTNSPLLADQRGFLRIVGVSPPNVDIGAFEFGAAASWSANTPSGANVGQTLGPVSVTFSNVSQGGDTYVIPIDAASAGTLPAGFTLGPGLPSFDISTTAVLTPPIIVCVQVPQITDPTAFAALTLFHGENGVLVDRTVSRDFPAKTVCASVDTLSPFVVAQSLAPTSANVEVGGRILTADGRGIVRAVITLTDAKTGETRSALSNSFGYYRFREVAVGNSYLVTAGHKEYRFSPQILTVFNEITDLDLTADKQALRADKKMR